MRISWLTAEEIAAAREALRAKGAHWDDHFEPDFVVPAGPAIPDWDRITEHVARAERVSEVVREHGVDAARARFAGTTVAIEAATLAAAAHEDEALDRGLVQAVFDCAIDAYVFYAPFLEMLIAFGKNDIDGTIETYERFVGAYERALANVPHGSARVGAARDGLADTYVTFGRIDDAEALFERRHDEDPNDVAVALSASRAFLAAGSLSHAVRWLGVGAARAAGLGRDDLASKLRQKQDAVRRRLS